MYRILRFTTEAKEQLAQLAETPALAGELKQVRKALGLLATNLKHPGLQTHDFTSLSTKAHKVFEAYGQNQTPGAYRIFWRYGPDEATGKKRAAVLTIIAITRHP
jgi:hypothetical protein